MIVPFAAGGTSDVIARVVAEEMAKSLGQPIVIENVAGAGGSTALTRAARAEADGYTIAIGNAGTSAAAYTIYPKLPFTPESFAPIAVVAKTFGIVALRKDFPAKNLQEFIAYAKKNPGKVNLGHAGIGSSNFLICKSFEHAAGIEVTLVGYRGAAPALTDAIGGQIDGVCDFGRLGVAGDRRQAGERPRRRLDGAACDLARSADVGGSRPSRFRGAGLERPVRAKGHAACDHRETERRGQDRRRERGGEEALSRSLHRRARRQRTRARSARATGDARRTRNTESCWKRKVPEVSV